MNSFVVEIWDDECPMCNLYTVRWDEAKDNETDKFFEKFDAQADYKQSAQQLYSYIIDIIGSEHGTRKEFFNRFENEVVGLPHQGRLEFSEVVFWLPNFPLRLYALKLRDDIVVLFNGGIKDGETNQESSLLGKWRDACAFAKRINEAISDGLIIINEEEARIENALNIDEEIVI